MYSECSDLHETPSVASRYWWISLVPSPTTSFSSLAVVLYRTASDEKLYVGLGTRLLVDHYSKSLELNCLH